jgi:hypothetical protein
MARITKAQIAEQQAAELAAEQLHAEQQAELKRMRAAKRAAAKAAAEAQRHAAATPHVEVQAEQVAQPFDAAAEDIARRAKLASALNDILADFEMPSWKRLAIGTVIGLVAAAGAGWMLGTVVGMLVVGAVAMTGMAWLGWVVWALGMIVTFIACSMLGRSTAAYIVTAKIDEHAGAVKNKVLGWFKSKDKAPIITGAFAAS